MSLKPPVFKNEKWVKTLYLTPLILLLTAIVLIIIPTLIPIQVSTTISGIYIIMTMVVIALYQICASMFGIMGIIVNAFRIARREDLTSCVVLMFLSVFYLLIALFIFYVGTTFLSM